ncbi:integrase catalytic domain-containing protein [Trichonephila clavipes]|nr:integrase catalytic domain-containing protein [Trichonephila clavipes]
MDYSIGFFWVLLGWLGRCEPNSSIPRDVNNSVLSASAKVFHPVVSDATNTDTGPNPPNVNNPSITSCSGFHSNSQVLLCTALVNVCDSFGGTWLCRVLLDPGSQACLITNSCLERLGLPRKRTNVRISCLGAFHALAHQILELMVFRRLSLHLILHLIFRFDLKLADPTFLKSGPIDILIGVNIALPMLKGQSLSLGDNKPFAVRSDLGWIVAGNVPSEDMFSSIAVNSIQVVTDELVSNFWKLDSVPEASLLTSEERACEDHFIDTYVRNEDGRYVVRLPFHSSPSKLRDSRESAIRRFKSLEHSLIKKLAIYCQYRDFTQEYLTLGHMELVPKNDYAKREAYYLRHHVVLRDSSTTKLRVVFDVSAKSTSGYSLNDASII